MNRFINWFTLRIEALKTWHNSEKGIAFRKDFSDFGLWLIIRMQRIGNNIVRLALIGIALNVISSFYPEFPNRFPTFYGWFDGWTQFVEFAIKTTLSGVYSLFTGNFSDFLNNSSAELQELLNQFITWLSNISF